MTISPVRRRCFFSLRSSISLNPGRYVGVAAGEAVSDDDFRQELETLNEQLEILNAQARELEQTIARNVAEILGA